MCKCGCDSCGLPPQGPTLIKENQTLISEGLNYHIKTSTPIFESVYRIGSENHLNMVKETRKLYSRGIIDLCEEDKHLIHTHLGEIVMYKGEPVPLDLPMVNTSELNEVGDMSSTKSFNFELEDNTFPDVEYYTFTTPKGYKYRVILTKEQDSCLLSYQVGTPQEVLDDETGEFIHGYKWSYELRTKENVFTQIMSTIVKIVKDYVSNNPDVDFIIYEPISNSIARVNKLIFTKNFPKAHLSKSGNDMILDIRPYKNIQEAKYKGKDVPLNKPKRGGSKAYYVYVRDPKTKKIKKVSFGSGGLRAKIKNKEARNAFAKRHRCSEKKDRTKAGYWSCNLPKYSKLLGLGSNMNTFW